MDRDHLVELDDVVDHQRVLPRAAIEAVYAAAGGRHDEPPIRQPALDVDEIDLAGGSGARAHLARLVDPRRREHALPEHLVEPRVSRSSELPEPEGGELAAATHDARIGDERRGIDGVQPDLGRRERHGARHRLRDRRDDGLQRTALMRPRRGLGLGLRAERRGLVAEHARSPLRVGRLGGHAARGELERVAGLGVALPASEQVRPHLEEDQRIVAGVDELVDQGEQARRDRTVLQLSSAADREAHRGLADPHLAGRGRRSERVPAQHEVGEPLRRHGSSATRSSCSRRATHACSTASRSAAARLPFPNIAAESRTGCRGSGMDPYLRPRSGMDPYPSRVRRHARRTPGRCVRMPDVSGAGRGARGRGVRGRGAVATPPAIGGAPAGRMRSTTRPPRARGR